MRFAIIVLLLIILIQMVNILWLCHRLDNVNELHEEENDGVTGSN